MDWKRLGRSLWQATKASLVMALVAIIVIPLLAVMDHLFGVYAGAITIVVGFFIVQAVIAWREARGNG